MKDKDMSQSIKPDKSYFGVIGLLIRDDSIRLGEEAVIRKIPNAGQVLPMRIDMSMDPISAGAVAQWAQYVTVEFQIIGQATGKPDNPADKSSYVLSSLIRIATEEEFSVPLVSNMSWVFINQRQWLYNPKIRAVALEHSHFSGTTKRPKKKKEIDDTTWRWIDDNLAGYKKLFDSESEFDRLAIIHSSLNSYHTESAPQMALLRIYIGFEALYGVDSHNFNSAACASAYLEIPGSKRKNRYQELAGYRRIRNSIVHASKSGSSPKPKEITIAIRGLRRALSQGMQRAVEETRLPDVDCFRRLLLAG